MHGKGSVQHLSAVRELQGKVRVISTLGSLTSKSASSVLPGVKVTHVLLALSSCPLGPRPFCDRLPVLTEKKALLHFTLWSQLLQSRQTQFLSPQFSLPYSGPHPQQDVTNTVTYRMTF